MFQAPLLPILYLRRLYFQGFSCIFSGSPPPIVTTHWFFWGSAPLRVYSDPPKSLFVSLLNYISASFLGSFIAFLGFLQCCPTIHLMIVSLTSHIWCPCLFTDTFVDHVSHSDSSNSLGFCHVDNPDNSFDGCISFLSPPTIVPLSGLVFGVSLYVDFNFHQVIVPHFFWKLQMLSNLLFLTTTYIYVTSLHTWLICSSLKGHVEN